MRLTDYTKFIRVQLEPARRAFARQASSHRLRVAMLLLGVLAAIVSPKVAGAAVCPPHFGDVNVDAKVNIVDVQCSILVVLSELGGAMPACTTYPELADLTCDGAENVADVQVAIVLVLGAAFDPVIDANGNRCPDSCEMAYCGDGICHRAMGESCPLCAADCGPCEPSGSCCSVLGAQSCGDAGCAACLCALDPYCCSGVWDGPCAEGAQIDCAAACGCEPLPKGECCVAGDTPGCNEPNCEACVCALDLFCCKVAWDPMCVSGAAADCALICPCGAVAGDATAAP